jgi:hypothetical protein
MNMKENIKRSHRLLFSGFCAISIAILHSANGQVYITNMGNGGPGSGTVGEYDLSTGTPINISLVTGLTSPTGIAASSGTLFVANYFPGTIGAFDLATGAALNTTFVTGLNHPTAVAVSGGKLFVANFFGGTIGEYDASTGAVLNASFITGLHDPTGIVIFGSSIFVTNATDASFTGVGSIGQYDLATGTAINTSLVSNTVNGPWGLTVSGGNLFVINAGNGSLGKYTVTGSMINGHLIALTNPLGITESDVDLFVVNGSGAVGKYTNAGATVNASFITGPSNLFPEPVGIIVVQPAPEPSTWALLVVGAASLIGLRRNGWFLSSRC